jgi:hypothetical protein
MKNFVSYSIVLDADGMESLSTSTSNDVVDRPIRSIEDVKAIEQELIIKYTPMMNHPSCSPAGKESSLKAQTSGNGAICAKAPCSKETPICPQETPICPQS